jgi:hypothetical protein
MKKLIILPLLLYAFIAYSQDEVPKEESKKQTPKQFYIGAETGMNFYSCETPEYDFIRAFHDQTESYQSTTLEWYFNQYHFHAITEFRLANDKLWLSTGLKYSAISTGLGRLSAWENSEEYFYVNLDNGNDENSHLYKVDHIQEFSSYLGVPVSIRISPYKVRFIRLYFKLGLDFNVLMSSSRKVNFINESMDFREDEILTLFNEPVDFYSTISPGVGFQLGKQNKPNIRFEANVPTFIISPQKFSFVNTYFGGGFNIVFLYPLTK